MYTVGRLSRLHLLTYTSYPLSSNLGELKYTTTVICSVFFCGAPGLRPGNILGKIFRGSGGGAPEKMFMMFRSTLDKMFRIFRSILVQNPGYTNRKSKYIMSTYALTLLQKFAFHLWIICSHKALSGECYKLASGHEASEKNFIN